MGAIEPDSQSPDDSPAQGICRILSLDGGGAKGFYSLGVLKELEAMLGAPLYSQFNLVFGTSTGAIIAALIGLGASVDEVYDIYRTHVPRLMSQHLRRTRSAVLSQLADDVFGTKMFDDMKTRVGIVATNWAIERPMIFKPDIGQAHGRKGSFVPGFGISVSDAVQASCSAYPFFRRKTVTTSTGDVVELIDGGYCANNPTLYAIADAVKALKYPRQSLRVVSIGVGEYPQPSFSVRPTSLVTWIARRLRSVQLLQKTLEINTQSMDTLRTILFGDVATVRVSEAYTQPEMATDLLEHDLKKLNVLRQRGRESFARHEAALRDSMTT